MTLERIAVGKVRETWVDPRRPDELLLVATDRVSAFDVVFRELVPDKGRILTAVSASSFSLLAAHLPTHLLRVATDVPPAWEGRTLLVRRLRMLPVECVVRGCVVGSAWESYRRDGTAFGRRLPAGLSFGAQLAEPIFTPTTKATTGHDTPLSDRELGELVGRARADELEAASRAVFAQLRSWFASHGLTLVDAKFEFGLDAGALVLADEVATPDAARIVVGDLGTHPRWLDKQVLRDWLVERGFRGVGEPPALTAAIVAELRSRYVEVYERLSGQAFSRWPGVGSTPYGGEERL